ncbi:hypothetical protein PUNSTDRAFT_139643 [Punctularia strigosozonata HHB-11173 SS5]|uniref:Uncharacterized protein n=1 Tax=Punctularia strigosozonata (strain HHB-11173) TaxID=741275 RepID=R7S271_PUNST|nr:uncharacterized protein PUNSTDRAFT_139643 [Punctularia strigosozonata HHB-11173 SS5]EIN03341.1 hypothetical protein PUNSTDRAFT_139643 [Punctularia strigosozonata HHB-11173 SS5]
MPHDTGDGILSTGTQDKRALSIWSDIYMHAGRRLTAESAAAAYDVYSYYFVQVHDNSTVKYGVTHFQEVDFVFKNPLLTQNLLSTFPGDAEIMNLGPYSQGGRWCPTMAELSPSTKERGVQAPGKVHEDEDYRAEASLSSTPPRTNCKIEV